MCFSRLFFFVSSSACLAPLPPIHNLANGDDWAHTQAGLCFTFRRCSNSSGFQRKIYCSVWFYMTITNKYACSQRHRITTTNSNGGSIKCRICKNISSSRRLFSHIYAKMKETKPMQNILRPHSIYLFNSLSNREWTRRTNELKKKRKTVGYLLANIYTLFFSCIDVPFVAVAFTCACIARSLSFFCASWLAGWQRTTGEWDREYVRSLV